MSLGIRPRFQDQILEEMATPSGPLSSRPQFEFTVDNFISLLNNIVQDGTPMVAGQMNNLYHPTNVHAWGDTDQRVNALNRWHRMLTVFERELDDSGPVAPLSTPFDPTIVPILAGRRILYESECRRVSRTEIHFNDRMYDIVAVRDLDTGAWIDNHYAMVQERRLRATRTNRRDWRIVAE